MHECLFIHFLVWCNHRGYNPVMVPCLDKLKGLCQTLLLTLNTCKLPTGSVVARSKNNHHRSTKETGQMLVKKVEDGRQRDKWKGKSAELRVRVLNVETLTEKIIDLTSMTERRCLDLCVQEKSWNRSNESWLVAGSSYFIMVWMGRVIEKERVRGRSLLTMEEKRVPDKMKVWGWMSVLQMWARRGGILEGDGRDDPGQLFWAKAHFFLNKHSNSTQHVVKKNRNYLSNLS